MLSTRPAVGPIAMTWVEIDLHANGSAVHVTGRGSRGERTAPRSLSLSISQLNRFRVAVGNAVARSEMLDVPLLAQARKIHEELFAEDLGELMIRASRAALSIESSGRQLTAVMHAAPAALSSSWPQ